MQLQQVVVLSQFTYYGVRIRRYLIRLTSLTKKITNMKEFNSQTWYMEFQNNVDLNDISDVRKNAVINDELLKLDLDIATL